MADFRSTFSDREREQYDDWVRHVRSDTVQKMSESAMVMQLITPNSVGKPDIDFAVQLGLAILMDKPILAVVMPGTDVPERLRRVADEVVVADMDTEAGKADLARRVKSFEARFDD